MNSQVIPIDSKEGVQLTRYNAACKAIAEAKSVDEVKEIRDKAQALKAYAMQAKNKQLEVDAAEIRIRAERRLGEMLKDEGPKQGQHKGNQYTGNLATNEDSTLSSMGISYDLSSRAKAIASIPEEEFEQTLAEHREEQQAVTGRTMEKLAKKAHVSHNSGENEWYTPPQFIEAAREVLGEIDLDPASCELANKTVKAKKFFSIENDGLNKKWSGNVWMNPPYGHPYITKFCLKFLEQDYEGNIESAIVLVNNATETGWLQPLLSRANAICFPRSRIKFYDKTGAPSCAPLQGQVFLYFGETPQNFKSVFSKFGVVLGQI